MWCSRPMASLLALLALLAAPACAAGRGAGTPSERPAAVPSPPAGPADCARLRPGEPLQARVEAAPEGTALCLAPGVYRGSLRLDRAVTVWGPRGAILRSNGSGTTVHIVASRAALLGVTVDGSGVRYDTEDSAVKVSGADDVRVEGVKVVRAVFGILAEKTNRTVIRGNDVEGDPSIVRGMRGDGIRLWETRHATIADNIVRNSRDLVVWYSPDNRIVHNRVEHGRYGTHFMYSSDNLVEGNVYRSNEVGIFVMYGRNLRLIDNDLLDAHGASGMGIGVKESGDLVVRGNRFVHDAEGLYLDTSPLERTDHDLIEGNTFTLTDTAVVFHGPSRRNRFIGTRSRRTACRSRWRAGATPSTRASSATRGTTTPATTSTATAWATFPTSCGACRTS